MIRYKIKFSLPFRRELRSIYYDLCLNLNSSSYADKILNKIQDYISCLDLFPESYSKIYIPNSSKISNLRKMPVDKYIIIYEVDAISYTIKILHIFDGRQNYQYKL